MKKSGLLLPLIGGLFLVSVSSSSLAANTSDCSSDRVTINGQLTSQNKLDGLTGYYSISDKACSTNTCKTSCIHYWHVIKGVKQKSGDCCPAGND